MKLRRTLSTLPLVFILYFCTSGGPYTTEELVAQVGPGLGLLILLLVPIFWSVPEPLIVLRRREPELRGAFRIPAGNGGVALLAAVPMATLVVVVGMEILQPDYGLPAVIGALGTAALGLLAYVVFERRPRGPGPGGPRPALAAEPPDEVGA